MDMMDDTLQKKSLFFFVKMTNTPCPSTQEVTYSSVEKLSKALFYHVQTQWQRPDLHVLYNGLHFMLVTPNGKGP
jgi:hypothetical protein